MQKCSLQLLVRTVEQEVSDRPANLHLKGSFKQTAEGTPFATVSIDGDHSKRSRTFIRPGPRSASIEEDQYP